MKNLVQCPAHGEHWKEAVPTVRDRVVSGAMKLVVEESLMPARPE